MGMIFQVVGQYGQGEFASNWGVFDLTYHCGIIVTFCNNIDMARTRSRSLWIPLSTCKHPKKTSSEQNITLQEKTREKLVFFISWCPFSSYQVYNANKKNKTQVRKTHWKTSCLASSGGYFCLFLAKRRFRRPGGCIQGGCSLGWTATCAAAWGAWGARGAWGSGTWWPDEKSIGGE